MSEILQTDESVRLYEYEPCKPDLDDYVAHFNPFHDPRNGQFTFRRGGGGSVTTAKKKSLGQRIHDHRVKKKRKASLEKARATRAKNIETRKAEAKSKEDVEKMREEAIKKNDLVTMYKNADKFSRNEIENALNNKQTLDRLASEVEKMTPKPVVKESTGRKMARTAKESVKSGLSNTAKSMITTASGNLLRMTVQELAVRAAKGTKHKFSNLSPEEKREVVMRIFTEKKK